MFKYDLTGEQAPAGEKQRRFVTKYREVTYIHFNEEKRENYEVIGRETVEEITVPPRIDAMSAVKIGFKVLDFSEKERAVWEQKVRNNRRKAGYDRD